MPESIGAMFAESARHYAERPAVKVRKGARLEEVTYAALYSLVKEFGEGLLSLGVAPSDRVFILSDNRKEWLVADLAILCIGATNVSRGSDSTLAEVEYIVNHSTPAVIIVEDGKQLGKIACLNKMTQEIAATIVLDDSVAKEDKQKNVYGYSDVLALGRKGDAGFENRVQQVKDGDLAAIVYTSGTTGAPKGVMLTHHNILSNIEAALLSIDLRWDDRFLSILPSWHMFERTVEYMILRRGASILYTNPRSIGKDMISEKPTYMVAVPRIWEAFYEKVCRKFSEQRGVRKTAIALLISLGKRYALAARAVRHEEICLSKGNPLRSLFRSLKAGIVKVVLLPAKWVGEKVVFRQVRLATGNCLKAGISGGGAFAGYLDDFFETVGIPILNGYGLTETSPIVSVRTVDHNVKGTIGRPIAGTEVRITNEEGKDVVSGAQGVIWVRGPQVMKGYYKDEEATRKVLKDGGWFDTGDLGRVTPNGDLVITGRVKDTIVLLGGENVEPEPIETALKGSAFIENVMVVGQDRKYLAALICPNYQLLAESVGNQAPDRHVLLRDPSINDLIKREITSRNNEASGFRQHEKVVKFTLVGEEWNRENGLMTPTLKLKRNVITERYREVIERMYT